MTEAAAKRSAFISSWTDAILELSVCAHFASHYWGEDGCTEARSRALAAAWKLHELERDAAAAFPDLLSKLVGVLRGLARGCMAELREAALTWASAPSDETEDLIPFAVRRRFRARGPLFTVGSPPFTAETIETWKRPEAAATAQGGAP